MAYKKTEKNRRRLLAARKKYFWEKSLSAPARDAVERASKEKTWAFNWKEGGYNSVRAETREQALAKAREIGKPGLIFKGLTVDPSTLRVVTSEELMKIDRSYGPYD